MSSQTQNLRLIKPASDDTADIDIINNNMDTIDAAVANRMVANTTRFDDGGDLNDQEPGSCWWGHAFSHAPNDSAGWMEVTRIGMYQLAFVHAGNTSAPTAFLRSKVNDVWQPWAQVVLTTSTYSSLTNTGVTITENSTYTVSVSSAKRYGNVVTIGGSISCTSAISAGSSVNPFNTNLGNAVISSDWWSGHTSPSGGAWVRAEAAVSANTARAFVMVGIL